MVPAAMIVLSASAAMLLFAAPAAAAVWCSPAGLALSHGGRKLYVACATGNRVEVWDTAQRRLLSQIATPGPVRGVALAAADNQLLVTSGSSVSVLRMIETASGREVASIRLGHTSETPVISPDGRFAYVPNRFTDDVSVVDLAARTELRRVKAAREPGGAAVSFDATRLFVINSLPYGRADAEYVAAEISVFAVPGGEAAGRIPLPNGSAEVRGIAVSPDGSLAAVTHLMARFYLPATQLERGWMETNALTILDVRAQRRLATVLLDDIDEGAANPWAVTWSTDGATIAVTHAGTHEVSIIDAAALLEKIKRTARETSNDLSFMMGLRKRVKLPGNGPRSLAVSGSRLYVGGYFSDTIEEVDLSQSLPAVSTFARLSQESMSAVRRGEMLFNDGSLCFQGWQSCASCHSPDARVDGLNWDLLNDGIGNPKNVRSLLLAHRTPPSMSHGVRENAYRAVRSGIRHILFAQLPEADAAAMDEYLKSLQPVPSPWLRDGKLSRAAERGKRIFLSQTTGCASCHPPGLFTDLKGYNVGTRGRTDSSGDFDTPTLIEIWRTAPYLHDGSAPALRDVIVRNKDDRHGRTSHLTPGQIADLVAYLQSL